MQTLICLLPLVLEGVTQSWMVVQKSSVTCCHHEAQSLAWFSVTKNVPLLSGTDRLSVLCPGTCGTAAS